MVPNAFVWVTRVGSVLKTGIIIVSKPMTLSRSDVVLNCLQITEFEESCSI